MNKSKEQKGYQLSAKGKDIYVKSELDRKRSVIPVSEAVSRFIDEGNPNTQPPATSDSKPGMQPIEVRDMGKSDSQTLLARRENLHDYLSIVEGLDAAAEEQSGQTIEDDG